VRPWRLDAVVASSFRSTARFRRARAFHPVGLAFRATVQVHGSAAAGPALAPGSHPAIVRFSRGIGWSPALPDVHGVAIRLIDAHGPGRPQDLLLSSVLSSRLGRFVPFLSATVSGPFYSTVAPYAGPQGRTVIGARFDGPPLRNLAALEDAVWSGDCTLGLLVTTGLKAWSPLGSLRVHADRLDREEEEALDLDPWNTAEGFQPTGWVNHLRRPAYAASRQGRSEASTPTSPRLNSSR
jgi:hypothetical protein